jgi:sigma-B regulation protein RsbU (phosphoserine phosphatase)
MSNWPVKYMEKEVFEKGKVLFEAGDKAHKIYYLNKGRVYLVERDQWVESGNLIEEPGIFTAQKLRMFTAACFEDAEFYTMDADEVVRRLSHEDPGMAMHLIQDGARAFVKKLESDTEAKEHIENELRVAHDIQLSMLPSEFMPLEPAKKDWDIFARLSPAKAVGGDFYDILALDNKRIGVLIGDVSGKGMPAALIMAQTISLFRVFAKEQSSPGACFRRLNQELYGRLSGRFISCLYLVIDTQDQSVRVCSAGHPPLFHYSMAKGELSDIDIPANMPLCVLEDTAYQEVDLKLDCGDRLVVFTDGIPELRDVGGGEFGLDTVRELILRSPLVAPELLCGNIMRQASVFSDGCQQHDDMTIIAIERKCADLATVTSSQAIRI